MNKGVSLSLHTPLHEAFRLKPDQWRACERAGIKTLRDLLFHFPSRYEAAEEAGTLTDMHTGDHVTVIGKVKSAATRKAYRKKIPLAEASLSTEHGTMHAVWFHQPYIARKLVVGTFVKLSGKIAERNGKQYLANPDVEEAPVIPEGIFAKSSEKENQNETLTAIYPESAGISSLWLRHHIKTLLAGDLLAELADPIPDDIRERYHLPALAAALVFIHAPRREADALAARKRFAFEEVFFIQLARLRDRARYTESTSFAIDIPESLIDQFTARFPFSFTNAQKNTLATIVDDLTKQAPMLRLLEGDVGSGKTAVAATAAYGVTLGHPKDNKFAKLQVAYMAPTEILARQHFEGFIRLFEGTATPLALITGSECRKFPSKTNPKESTKISRAQLLRWIASGEIPIVIGTHAITSEKVAFKNLALVMIDEQHRFGTRQRAKLTRKNDATPHLLSMTATPIPRTLALTLYGDLDLSVIDEMPPGRKPVATEIVPPRARTAMYEKIRKEIISGRQAYVICPRINEPDPDKASAVIAKSVKEEAARLKREIFPEYEIGVLHGALRPKEKEDVMAAFEDGDINILVATSVVEVGVNVPNATLIVIEGAERFGLAQLHQLRGRVLRSTHQAHCFLLTESSSAHVLERLKALERATTGFALAELDLSLRGTGELSGERQSGISDIGMEAIKNIKLVEAARIEAAKLVARDPELTFSSALLDRVNAIGSHLHFE